jgi:hypothetical protein
MLVVAGPSYTEGIEATTIGDAGYSDCSPKYPSLSGYPKMQPVMLRRAAKWVRRGFGRVVLGESRIEQLSPLELQQRIRKLERQKQQFKGKMDESKQEFDDLIDKAGDADSTRVPELEMEASLALKRYEAFRSLWTEILNGLRFLNQAALGKRIDNVGMEGIPKMNPQQFERAAQNIEQTLEQRESRRDSMSAADDRMEDTWQGHNTHADSLTDERVSAAINAARSGDDVPTLDELAEESFASTTESESTETLSGGKSPQSGDGPAEF